MCQLDTIFTKYPLTLVERCTYNTSVVCKRCQYLLAIGFLVNKSISGLLAKRRNLNA